MSQATDIDSEFAELIASLTAKQIAALKVIMSKPRRMRDRTRAKRMATNKLYFNSAPAPYVCDSFKVYVAHSDAIREQVLGGGV